MSKKALGVHSEAGKLHKVMVCSPGLAHLRLTPNNCDELLFDDVIWVSQAKRDHFDFMTKMRERGIEVVEMHNLLEETVKNPEALKWILDRKITANSVGLGLQSEVRSFIEGLEARKVAEFLIGGVSGADLAKHKDSEAAKMFNAYLGESSFLFPPLPNTQFTRDTTCWIYGGVTLNPMYWPARRQETLRDQIEQTTQAETEKQLAVINAEREKQRAEIEKQTAELLRDKASITAQATKITADAEAYARKAVIEADGALQPKLDALVQINKVWAEAASQAPVPGVMMGGSGNGASASRQDEIGQLMGILATKAARDLSLDMKVKE